MSQPLNLAPRDTWADALRLLAMVLVVLCHCCDPFTFNPNAAPTVEMSYWGAFWQCMSRASVPLFACLTGFLLLPVKEDMGTFYKKRIFRVLWPFLIWSVLYNIFPLIAMSGFGASVEQVQNFFVGASADQSEIVGNLAHIPLTFSAYAVHMWYIYLIIGLYLFLPIFSAWVEKATQKQKMLYLAIWGVTLFIPYLREISPAYWGACDWNGFDMLYYFGGFSGYMLLGHVIGRMKPMRLSCALPLGVLLFITGYVLTFAGFRFFQTGAYHTELTLMQSLSALTPGEAYVPIHEIPLLFCSPNVALMVIALLLLFRKVKISNPLMVRALANLTTCGFAIYMIHYFFVGPANMLTNALGTPIQAVIPVSCVFAFLASWVTAALLKKLIPGKWFLG